MKAFSRLANPLIKDTRFLNVIKGGLKTPNNISKNGGEIHIDLQNLAGLPTNGVNVYGRLLDDCSAKPLQASSLFESAKSSGGDTKILDETKKVWNLTNPDNSVL